MVKVEILKGRVDNGKEVFKKGDTLELKEDEAEKLIKLGMARELGGKGKAKEGGAA